MDLPNNYFLVRLLQKDGWAYKYQQILYGGPWVIHQHAILVQKWSPTFDPFHNPLGRIATWVRIPNIPIQCYNRTFISQLGNRIGKTMKVDLLTPSELQADTARVELDLQKKLVSKVIAANMAYHVEYEGLGLICFGCGRYGHRKENCSWTPSSPTQQQNSTEQRETKVTAPSPPATHQESNVDPFGKQGY